MSLPTGQVSAAEAVFTPKSVLPAAVEDTALTAGLLRPAKTWS
jgi:hypothetical protein